MPEVGNWTIEQCITEGTGTLILTGTDLGLARWRDSMDAGQVYYSIQDGINKEAGIGTFNGINQITRDTITATLVNNVYDDSNPDPIDLSGASIVASAFNTVAFDSMVDGISANAAAIAVNEAGVAANVSDIADNVAAILLRATTAYVDAADDLAFLRDGSRDLAGSLRVGDGSFGGSGVISIRAYGIMDGVFYFLRPDESVAGKLSWINDEESIDIIQYGYDTNLETILSVKNGNVSLTGIDVLVPTNDKHLTHKKYVDDADALKVNKTGDAMTGNLLIKHDASPQLNMQIESASDYLSIQMFDENSQIRMSLRFLDSTGYVILQRYDSAGAVETQLAFENDGNVTVNGAAPTQNGNLTRRDYVDGKFDDGLTGTWNKADITSMTFTDGLLTAIT